MASLRNNFFVLLIAIGSFLPCCVSIFCFDCNSVDNPLCVNPSNTSQITQVDCDYKPLRIDHTTLGATMCRKVKLIVKDEVRVYRSCGYISNEEFNNFCVVQLKPDLHSTTCTCNKDNCNVGVIVQPLRVIIMLVPVIIAYVISARIFQNKISAI